MIDLSTYGDQIVLSTAEVCQWTGRPRKAILGSRIPPVAMHARQKHFRASDVKKWVLGGDRAFDEQRTQGRSLQVSR